MRYRWPRPETNESARDDLECGNLEPPKCQRCPDAGTASNVLMPSCPACPETSHEVISIKSRPHFTHTWRAS